MKNRNKKKVFIIYLIICFFLLNFILGNNLLRKNKIIKVCLCTSGKKENLYVKEFVEHYKKYGVNKIYIYDNNDLNDEHFDDVISDYIING